MNSSQSKSAEIKLWVLRHHHPSAWDCDNLEQAWRYVKSLTVDAYEEGVPEEIRVGDRVLYRLEETAGRDRWDRVDDAAPPVPEEFS